MGRPERPRTEEAAPAGGLNIEAALRAVELEERKQARLAVGSGLPTANSSERFVLPATIKVACRDARDHHPGEEADLAVFAPT